MSTEQNSVDLVKEETVKEQVFELLKNISIESQQEVRETSTWKNAFRPSINKSNRIAFIKSLKP